MKVHIFTYILNLLRVDYELTKYSDQLPDSLHDISVGIALPGIARFLFSADDQKKRNGHSNPALKSYRKVP